MPPVKYIHRIAILHDSCYGFEQIPNFVAQPKTCCAAKLQKGFMCCRNTLKLSHELQNNLKSFVTHCNSCTVSHMAMRRG